MADKRETLHEPLTEREREIVKLIAHGLTNQQIAAQLYLTLDTVKWYNRQIYQKMGVHSRTQAIASMRAWGALGEPSPAIKHNLPTQGTLFVGRKHELATIQALLTDPACRLLTLLGPGGIGKTRLALQLAAEVLAEFTDGVYVAFLASIREPELVVSAIAQVMGVREVGSQPLQASVVEYLRNRQSLLLLDNFEQVLPAAPLVGELLAVCPRLKVVVTAVRASEVAQATSDWLRVARS